MIYLFLNCILRSLNFSRDYEAVDLILDINFILISLVIPEKKDEIKRKIQLLYRIINY